MVSSLITQVRNLQRRRARKRERTAVAEGIRLVEEALDAGVPIQGVLVARDIGEQPRAARLLERLAAHDVPVEEIAARDLDTLADTETPQGILAVIEPRRFALDDVVPAPGRAALVLDAIQDPGNVGTMLRTALALGACGAILLKGTADATNPKALRSAMGATFRLPAATADVPEFGAWLARHAVEAWVAAADGAPVARSPLPQRLAVIVGNEGAGVSAPVRALARRQVAIPLAAGAESLNVAVAAGIILHEVRRGA
jgi:TrmH family RNA methyltransferase